MNKPKPIYIWSKDRLVDFPIAEEIMIEKLEKLKEEMKEERDSYDLSCKNTFNVCIELIDKLIAELKGEQK